MSGGAHDVPSDIKSASLEKFFPPCTVRRQIWVDALKPCHSGVSTDVLLFSEIQLSLVINQVFKRGLPHYAFRMDCLTRLWVLVSQAMALAQCDLCLRFRAVRFHRGMFSAACSPRKTRRVRHRMRPTRVRDKPVCVPSPMTADQGLFRT